MNRGEKKARKAILKLGLKAVPNVLKVVVRKGKSASFVITRPDVFRVPGTDTYCIFGQPDEDGAAGGSGASAGAGGAADYSRGGAGGAEKYARAAAQLRQSVAAPSGGDALEESADETGLEAKDIELVVTQAGVSRGKAVAALRKCGGDIVNAIMCVCSLALAQQPPIPLLLFHFSLSSLSLLSLASLYPAGSSPMAHKVWGDS